MMLKELQQALYIQYRRKVREHTSEVSVENILA